MEDQEVTDQADPPEVVERNHSFIFIFPFLTKKRNRYNKIRIVEPTKFLPTKILPEKLKAMCFSLTEPNIL